MISYYIISYHIAPYHVISYHIISYHIISYHTISYHIISYHTISYHIISYHIISYRIISYHIISGPGWLLFVRMFFKYVSCEFDHFTGPYPSSQAGPLGVPTGGVCYSYNISKISHACCQGGHQQQVVTNNNYGSNYTYFIPTCRWVFPGVKWGLYYLKQTMSVYQAL